MQALAEVIFKHLASARWLELDAVDLAALVEILENSDAMYIRALGKKMKNQSTIVLTISDGESE